VNGKVDEKKEATGEGRGGANNFAPVHKPHHVRWGSESLSAKKSQKNSFLDEKRGKKENPKI